MPNPKRRDILATTAGALLAGSTASARTIHGQLPWQDGKADPPTQVGDRPGWRFFTAGEAATMEAIVDRFIPPDPETPGGKDAGCVVFIDRQLAGPYGSWQDYYMHGPFHQGTESQGDQNPATPAQRYRTGLAEIDKYCKANRGNKTFAQLSDDQKDSFLKDMEAGKIKLENLDAKGFFDIILIDTQQGFFADPVYGGNKDMVSWKMIGFPGAHYDYRDWVERHNQRFPLPPVSIREHPTWGHS